MIRPDYGHLGDDLKNQGVLAKVLAHLREGTPGVKDPKPHSAHASLSPKTSISSSKENPYGHVVEIHVTPYHSRFFSKVKHSEGEEEHLGDAFYRVEPQNDPHLVTIRQLAQNHIREMLRGSGMARAGIQIGQRLLRTENYVDLEEALVDPQVSFYADPQNIAAHGEMMASLFTRLLGHDVCYVEEKLGGKPVYKLEGVSLHDLAELGHTQLHSGQKLACALSGTVAEKPIARR